MWIILPDLVYMSRIATCPMLRSIMCDVRHPFLHPPPPMIKLYKIVFMFISSKKEYHKFNVRNISNSALSISRITNKLIKLKINIIVMVWA